jgi:hypothetical protein
MSGIATRTSRAWLAVLVVVGLAIAVSAPTAPPAAAAPATTVSTTADDPVLVPMFDGTTLDGWTASKADQYTVKNGAIHSTGKGRGWIYYNKAQYGSFRWLFHVKQVKGNHKPTVLIWGTTTPIRDALSAIQFQPPNGGHWDYRPGHNDGGSKYFTKLPHPSWDAKKWAQCELLANQETGYARMACCPLTANAPRCKGVEVLQFRDTTAGRVAPIAIQIHNKGIEDEYKNLYVESPVANPDELITTKY